MIIALPSAAQDNNYPSTPDVQFERRELSHSSGAHQLQERPPSSISIVSSTSFSHKISATSRQESEFSMYSEGPTKDHRDEKNTDNSCNLHRRGEFWTHDDDNDMNIMMEAKTKPLDYRFDWSVAATNSLRNLCSSLLAEKEDYMECESVCSFDMDSVPGDDWRRESISDWTSDDDDDDYELHI